MRGTFFHFLKKSTKGKGKGKIDQQGDGGSSPKRLRIDGKPEVLQSNSYFQHDERGSASDLDGRSFGESTAKGAQGDDAVFEEYSMDSSSDDDDETETYDSDEVQSKWPPMNVYAPIPKKDKSGPAAKNKGPPKKRVQLVCSCGKEGFNTEDELRNHKRKAGHR